MPIADSETGLCLRVSLIGGLFEERDGFSKVSAHACAIKIAGRQLRLCVRVPVLSGPFKSSNALPGSFHAAAIQVADAETIESVPVSLVSRAFEELDGFGRVFLCAIALFVAVAEVV